MRLKQLDIRHFRGIRRLNWTLPKRESLICLVGSGDAGKSTILDALELVLSPRWNVRIVESDFFGGDLLWPIEILATVADVPPELLTQQRFGLNARGWSPNAELHDEPEDDDEDVLTIRFSVDGGLEPTWTVVNDRQHEPQSIGARDRALLGSSRLDREVERHLKWGRGSALATVTASTTEMDQLLIEVGRAARAAANEAELLDLVEAAAKAQAAAKDYGAGIEGDFHPALDASFSQVTSGSFSLHVDEIPLTLTGLGTRRLVSLALQSLALREGALVLIDEIEQGLEPHRLRHLLQLLHDQLDVQPPAGQAIATTHSAVCIEELRVRDLYVVRSSQNRTELRRARSSLQATARAAPEALLARRVIVCEGKTEVGVVRGLRNRWREDHGAPLGHVGAVAALGGGDTTGRVVRDFLQLGFETALLGDSDKPFTPPAEKLEELGATCFLWSGSMAIEERVAADLPLEALSQHLSIAVNDHGEASVRDSLRGHIIIPSTGPLDPQQWVADGVDEGDLRRAIGEAAKTKKWFKRIDHGEEVGRLIERFWADLEGTDLRDKLSGLGQWAYGA